MLLANNWNYVLLFPFYEFILDCGPVEGKTKPGFGDSKRDVPGLAYQGTDRGRLR